ncbi:MAG: helix-turn-helix domain-containing protein [Hyphomonadaceae bacterium]|nr:helix-turn-helix domain-containing protein [Hyphomonadaceae bacterium]
MRIVKLLTYPDAVLLDIAAPLQVFRTACSLSAEDGLPPPYDVRVESLSGGAITTELGAAIDTDAFSVQPIDTFLIPGATNVAVDRACKVSGLVDAVRAQATVARRVGAMGPGAFVLARAGLLSGRRVAAHWTDTDLFLNYSDIDFVVDAYAVDGKFWTSGGLLSATDLALAMVEHDHGEAIATRIARHLVADTRRRLGEPQLSARAEAQVDQSRIRALMQWIVANPAADLSTAALASRAHLSLRSFHRHFVAETGETPARFVERARVEAARCLLLTTEHKLDAIAVASGFGSASVMHGAFVRLLGASPSKYRKRNKRSRGLSE